MILDVFLICLLVYLIDMCIFVGVGNEVMGLCLINTKML